MAGVENDMTIAKADYEIALKNYNAMEDMYKGGIASGKEYTTAKEELQKAQAALDKATSISGLYGESNKTYYVTAPISGVIVSRNVNPAMQIRADYSDNLFTISNLGDVWVMANIFESDIAKVRKDYDVDVTTLSYPDTVIKGKVDKLYDVLDDVTKVMKARIRLDNKDNQLKPGMFANVKLHFREDLEKPEISSNAVIFDNSKNYVVVYRGKCDFEVREINIYKTLDDKTYVESGLKIGERVIVNDNLLIYDQLVD
jgi:cobalt-zinc-cadmium efflux system membrane fusion protein